ncbi:MAG: DUF3052 domain-containing protein [Planctomycetota bacterium]
MAGYSGTPLAKKLGLREGATVALLGVPEGFVDTLEPLPAGITLRADLRAKCDVIVFCADRAATLERRAPALRRALVEDGGLWLCWPKRASGVPTDLEFARVQACGLGLGLVDNKTCAVDETWSGLRFVVRRADRKSGGSR